MHPLILGFLITSSCALESYIFLLLLNERKHFLWAFLGDPLFRSFVIEVLILRALLASYIVVLTRGEKLRFLYPLSILLFGSPAGIIYLYLNPHEKT